MVPSAGEARIRRYALCDGPTARSLYQQHGDNTEAALAALGGGEHSTAELQFGAAADPAPPVFVLVGGEHRSTAHDFHHTSLLHIGDAFATLRSCGIPRSSIVVVAQLADALEHAQAQATHDSAWCSVTAEIRARCAQLLAEGGADYDHGEVNPGRVYQILSGVRLGSPLFLAVYSHGDQHPIHRSIEDSGDSALNEWYWHMPYACAQSEQHIYRAVHTDELRPSERPHYHFYAQQLRACLQIRLRHNPCAPVVCLLNFCRSGGFLNTLKHGSQVLQTARWPVLLMSSSQATRDALVGGLWSEYFGALAAGPPADCTLAGLYEQAKARYYKSSSYELLNPISCMAVVDDPKLKDAFIDDLYTAFTLDSEQQPRFLKSMKQKYKPRYAVWCVAPFGRCGKPFRGQQDTRWMCSKCWKTFNQLPPDKASAALARLPSAVELKPVNLRWQFNHVSKCIARPCLASGAQSGIAALPLGTIFSPTEMVDSSLRRTLSTSLTSADQPDPTQPSQVDSAPGPDPTQPSQVDSAPAVRSSCGTPTLREGEWQCLFCTFVNLGQNVCCNLCGGERVADEVTPPILSGARGPLGRAAVDGIAVAVLDLDGCTTTHQMAWAVGEHKSEYGVAEVFQVSGEQVADGILESVDVVLGPGGGHFAMLRALGPEGQHKLREFISAGGGFVGVCGGAYLAEALGIVPLLNLGTNVHFGVHGGSHLQPTPAFDEVFGPDARASLSQPGAAGEIAVDNPPIMIPLSSEVTPLALCANDVAAEFLERNGLVGGPEAGPYAGVLGRMTDSAAILHASYGKGRMILFAGHPENSGRDKQFHKRRMIAMATAWAAENQPDRAERAVQMTTRDATPRGPVEWCKSGYERYRGSPTSLRERLRGCTRVADPVAFLISLGLSEDAQVVQTALEQCDGRVSQAGRELAIAKWQTSTKQVHVDQAAATEPEPEPES